MSKNTWIFTSWKHQLLLLSLQHSLNSCKQSGNITTSGDLWPPFRLPSPVSSPYTDPQRIISCRSFHAVIFMLLYKALNEGSTTDHLLALTVYLLELTTEYQAQHRSQGTIELHSLQEVHFPVPQIWQIRAQTDPILTTFLLQTAAYFQAFLEEKGVVGVFGCVFLSSLANDFTSSIEVLRVTGWEYTHFNTPVFPFSPFSNLLKMSQLS